MTVFVGSITCISHEPGNDVIPEQSFLHQFPGRNQNLLAGAEVLMEGLLQVMHESQECLNQRRATYR